MLFRSLALAAVATAFVIVPEISENDENIFKALPIENYAGAVSHGIPESAFDQSVSVPCRECKGRNTQLRLDFTIKDDSKLLLNEFELYPNADPWGGDLEATLVHNRRKPKHGRPKHGKAKHGKAKHGKARSEKLGYSLAVYPKAVAKEDSVELIEVDLKIIEVGNRFVDSVPTVKVELIKAPGGSLAMSSVGFDQHVEASCTTIWCRAKELADKLWAQAQKIKGCGKAAPPQLDSEAKDASSPAFDLPGAEDMPQVVEPTITSQEEWRHLFKSVAGHIIMPIIMGVTAGVAVAFIALCIQSMARRFSSFVRSKRNGEPCSEFHKAPYNEQATVDEKAQLMA